MNSYYAERRRIAERIDTETARVAFILSNYLLAALMSEAGAPWWITGTHVIANTALTVLSGKDIMTGIQRLTK